MWPRPVKWDLGTLWEGVAVKYQLLGRPIPARWTLIHRLMAELLIWGAR
jgi:hypothetical protein